MRTESHRVQSSITCTCTCMCLREETESKETDAVNSQGRKDVVQRSSIREADGLITVSKHFTT